jgi:hypothetical protein
VLAARRRDHPRARSRCKLDQQAPDSPRRSFDEHPLAWPHPAAPISYIAVRPSASRATASGMPTPSGTGMTPAESTAARSA